MIVFGWIAFGVRTFLEYRKEWDSERGKEARANQISTTLDQQPDIDHGEADRKRLKRGATEIQASIKDNLPKRPKEKERDL